MGNKIRYMYIDILKTVAIFAIIISHVCIIGRQAAILNIPFTHFQHIGKVGVPLFLMISGALLIGQKKYDFLDFFKRRFSRIFIPHIFWVIIYFILGLTIIPDYYGLFNYSTPASLSISYFWQYSLV